MAAQCRAGGGTMPKAALLPGDAALTLETCCRGPRARGTPQGAKQRPVAARSATAGVAAGRDEGRRARRHCCRQPHSSSEAMVTQAAMPSSSAAVAKFWATLQGTKQRGAGVAVESSQRLPPERATSCPTARRKAGSQARQAACPVPHLWHTALADLAGWLHAAGPSDVGKGRIWPAGRWPRGGSAPLGPPACLG